MSDNQPPLDPALANHILARMGEAGQPPEHGIRHVNVGNEHFLEILRGIVLKGVGLAALWEWVVPMAALMVAILAIAILRFMKQLD